MASRDLEIEIVRNRRPVESIDLNADPDNIPGLQAILKGWLEGGRWARSLWPQFSADVRYAGQHKVRKTVRL